jgi:hypothetical protein
MSSNELFPRGLLRQVCPLVAAGLTDAEIGVKLNADETAVSEYVSWLLELLELTSRKDLVASMADDAARLLVAKLPPTAAPSRSRRRTANRD